MAHQYSFPDFIDYCTNYSSAYKLDGEVFWYNTIPAPSVLIKKLFFNAHESLKQYNNHLLSAVVLSIHDIQSPDNKLFNLFPDPIAVTGRESLLREVWNNSRKLSNYRDFEERVVSFSGIDEHQLSFDEFLFCLTHKGKKYERLYYPDSINSQFEHCFPKVRTNIGRKKVDMIGNVIADNLGIYRAGFGDAFAGVFNRYLDFKFDIFPHVDPRSADQGQVELVSVRKVGSITPVDYAGGNLWEPSLDQGGNIGAQLDKHHPFNYLTPETKSQLLILALANEEMRIFSESKKTVIEEFRYRVSRTLKDFANST